ncbi:MAG: 2Fe-2S iron-sulfur cluster-binding protein, partial [Gammaproteobacteria bacterium]
MIRMTVNGQAVALECDPDKPLLWALREDLGLTGTKYGCGIAQCRACTVHLDGKAVPSCQLPVARAAGA